jgi:hypothetical protein
MYQAKKIIYPLELEVVTIHACRNDCMLFHNKDAMLEECHVCEHHDTSKVTKISKKMTWGRIKKLKECQLRWHGISP